MLTDKYLYGEEVEVPPIPNELIAYRIELLDKHLEKLLCEDWRTRDNKRVKDVIAAVKFWEELYNGER